MKTTSRRKALTGPLTVDATLVGLANRPTQKRVHWLRLKKEIVGEGDMWASHNPNTPNKQIGGDYNLIMQAVHNDYYGEPANKIAIGNGGFWRPIAIVDC